MNRQAQAALDAARPAIARLDRSRHAEELAADLIEAWSGVETALRSLVGGTPLGGQNLIRETRQRQLITFDQANALAEFHAARERANDTAYHPTDADINAAREGFLKLEAAVMMPDPPADATPVPGEAMSTKGLRDSPLGVAQPVPLPSKRRPWVLPVVGLLVLALVGAGAWWLVGRSDDGGIAQGVEYWQRGQRELAVGEFTRASRENPASALPHVYLSRMAREVGNMTLANQEASTAVRKEPNNYIALREMGSYLLATNNAELARRFFVRAVEANGEDLASRGLLGCALLRLGRTDEGMRWLNRAGQGTWSACAQRMVPPGMTPGAPAPLPR